MTRQDNHFERFVTPTAQQVTQPFAADHDAEWLVSYPGRVSKPLNEGSSLRNVRGVLLAVSSAVLAVSAHAVADGGTPGALPTLVLTALIGWVSTQVADRIHGLPGILAVLSAAQLVMHTVLTALAPHGHGHPAEPATSVMLLTHAGAVVLVATLLAHAESMLRAALACLRRLLPVVFTAAPVPAEAPAKPAPRAPEARRAESVLLRRVCARRGPPAVS
jgi:hypothetical protein